METRQEIWVGAIKGGGLLVLCSEDCVADWLSDVRPITVTARQIYSRQVHSQIDCYHCNLCGVLVWAPEWCPMHEGPCPEWLEV
jgi:hypothetical protein